MTVALSAPPDLEPPVLGSPVFVVVPGSLPPSPEPSPGSQPAMEYMDTSAKIESVDLLNRMIMEVAPSRGRVVWFKK